MPKPDVQTALLLLLVTAFALPWQSVAVLAATGGVVILGLAASNGNVRSVAWRSVQRMRWLLLSLLVLALFFTPGEPVFQALGNFSPSWNGLYLMVERGLLLITLALLAAIFLSLYSAADIVRAIHRLLVFMPQRAARRVALRLYLVLEELPGIEQRVRSAQGSRSSGWAGKEGKEGKEGRFMPAAVALISDIEAGAISANREHLSDNDCSGPGWHELILPLLLLGIFMFTAVKIS